MNWTSIIIALIGVVSGSSVTCFLFYPQMKRNRELENDKKAIEQWKELYNVSYEDSKQKSNLVDKLYDDLKLSRHENNDLKAENTSLKIFECTCINCDQRKPPLGSSVQTIKKRRRSDKSDKSLIL